AAAVFGCCARWLGYGVGSARGLLTHNLRRGVLLGVVCAGVTAAIVFTETATAHPKGLGFAAAIAWRGVVYGATDGVLLSVFPILAVFAAFSTRPLRERGKPAVAAPMVPSRPPRLREQHERLTSFGFVQRDASRASRRPARLVRAARDGDRRRRRLARRDRPRPGRAREKGPRRHGAHRRRGAR